MTLSYATQLTHATTRVQDASSLSDSVFNYDIGEEIGRSSTCVVYRGTCRRGRLRNRLVAVKKVPHASEVSAGGVVILPSPAKLHHTLFHPSIVSLLSFLSTPAAEYHVLEYCSNGSLHQVLHSSPTLTLCEPELRGIVKGIVDGLIYLRKELVIHRDIKPSNILLNQSGRVKISDFGLAVRVPSQTSTVTTTCGSSHYVSPQIVAREPYGFETDLWSLGALILTSLTGVPPFDAPSTPAIFRNISLAAYALPNTASPEARDVVSGLLQINPSDRTSLDCLSHHRFLGRDLSTKPLDHPAALPYVQATTLIKPNLASQRYPIHLSRATETDGVGLQWPSNKHPPKRNYRSDTWKIPENVELASATRRINSAPTLNSQDAPSSPFLTLKQEEYRIAGTHSRTESRVRTPALTADDSSTSTVSCEALADHICEPGINDINLDFHPLQHLKARGSLPLQDTKKVPEDQDAEPSSDAPLPVKASNNNEDQAKAPQISQTFHEDVLGGRLTPLNTEYLTPQTQKVLKGQVIVLPSKSVLVDLREGERRKRRKGNEVLLISPDGAAIQVYSAPHLSTPCCLAEPVGEYNLTSLPQEYVAQYSDAAKVVNQMKQKIPKFVSYRPEGQCTLMANEPFGDIEILVSAPSYIAVDKFSPKSCLRLRLRQARRELEISKSIYQETSQKPTGQSHLSKKVFSLPRAGYHSDILKDISLAEDETTGALLLQQFLATCRAIESMASNAEPVQSVSTTHKSHWTSTKHLSDRCGTCPITASNGNPNVSATTVPRSNYDEQTCATAGFSTSTTNNQHIISIATAKALRPVLPRRPAKFSQRATPTIGSDSDVNKSTRSGYNRRLSDAGSGFEI